jgi:hypothetical protein
MEVIIDLGSLILNIKSGKTLNHGTVIWGSLYIFSTQNILFLVIRSVRSLQRKGLKLSKKPNINLQLFPNCFSLPYSLLKLAFQCRQPLRIFFRDLVYIL